VFLLHLLIFAVLFVSTLTRSALGFGDALIAMPLLVMVVGIQTAAPLVALVATTIAMIILWRSWYIVDFKDTWRVMLALGLGIPLGLILLRGVSEQLMQALLGVLIIGFSLYNLMQPQVNIRRGHVGLAYVFGFFAGVVGGAYNTVGPLLVVYGQLRQWSPHRFRATLQGCFLPAYACIIVGHGFAGLLTPQVFKLYSLSLPIVFAAIFLGGKLNASFGHEHFTRYVNIALVFIGMALCLRSFF
jgi:uncharacterized membrane protein YfcA